MKLKLPDSIASSQDLAALTSEVHVYAKWVARESIRQRVSGKGTEAHVELSAEASELVRTWGAGKPLTQASIDSLLKQLEMYRKTAPSITITLPAVPSGELKAKLVNWMRQNLSSDMLVNFRLNRNLLGGMVVAYGSHIFDWSFRRKLLDSPVKFHEVLNRVR